MIEIFVKLADYIIFEKNSVIHVWQGPKYTSEIYLPKKHFPANIYFFKVNNRNTKKRCEILLTMKIEMLWHIEILGWCLPYGKRCLLVFVVHRSSGGVTIKIPYGVDVLLQRPALHSTFFFYNTDFWFTFCKQTFT